MERSGFYATLRTFQTSGNDALTSVKRTVLYPQDEPGKGVQSPRSHGTNIAEQLRQVPGLPSAFKAAPPLRVLIGSERRAAKPRSAPSALHRPVYTALTRPERIRTITQSPEVPKGDLFKPCSHKLLSRVNK